MHLCLIKGHVEQRSEQSWYLLIFHAYSVLWRHLMTIHRYCVASCLFIVLRNQILTILVILSGAEGHLPILLMWSKFWYSHAWAYSSKSNLMVLSVSLFLKESRIVVHFSFPMVMLVRLSLMRFGKGSNNTKASSGHKQPRTERSVTPVIVTWWSSNCGNGGLPCESARVIFCIQGNLFRIPILHNAMKESWSTFSSVNEALECVSDGSLPSSWEMRHNIIP